MRTYLLLSVVVLLSCSKPIAERPNIILINIDDMGWRDVGFMGSDYYQTPNLDKLSKQGMRFTNGYASAANCAPSRASLMTGKWTTRHGIYTVMSSERGKAKDRKIIPTPNITTLASDFTIFPQLLQNTGYATCHAGKWHLSESPLDFGFDVNIGGGHNGHPSSYYPPYKNVSVEAGENDYLTDLIMEKTLQFIDTVQGPFFLNYSPYAVHTPIQPVTSLLEKYENKPTSNGQNNAKYATMVDNLDRNIGLLLAQLEKRNLTDNTLVIFTSDNGGLYGITQQPPLRAGKGSYYEGGIRVPFLFVWPEKIATDIKSDIPMTNLDLYPTILEAAQIKSADYEPDGQSLWPVLRQEVTALDRQLFWHFPIYLQAYNKDQNENRDPLFRTRPGSVMRHGNWKLHYYFEDHEVELYDLSNDIGERKNLATTQPKKTEEMLKYLQNWWSATNAPIPAEPNPDYRPD